VSDFGFWLFLIVLVVVANTENIATSFKRECVPQVEKVDERD